MSRGGAFFDMDGTLVATHIVHQYVYFRRRLLPRWVGPLWTAAYYLTRGPYLAILDKISRTRLNVVFYRGYGGLPAETVRALAGDCFRELLGPHLFGEAVACVAEHRSAGRRLVLVTGSLDFVVAPVAAYLGVDDVVAPRLMERDGHFTGQLDGPPIGDEEKARRIRAHADALQLDLADSYAYGDSIADLPMLELVGHPHVVNADGALAEVAAQNGWPSLTWTKLNEWNGLP